MVNISGLAIVNGRIAFGAHAAGDRHGGAIWNAGALTLQDVYLANNRVEDFRDGGRGGAIYNSSSGTLNLVRSTLAHNESVREGGAIYNAGTLDVINSTLSTNRTRLDSRDDPDLKSLQGGAIYNADNATADLSFATITRNLAGHSFIPLEGSGVYNAATLTLDNTIVANNGEYPYNGFDGATDPDGQTTSNGHNFIGSNGPSGNFQWLDTIEASDQVGTPSDLLDPQLTDLLPIAGSIPMHGVLPTSPVFDKGNPIAAPGTDQRGVARSDTAPDIGAFELQDFSWETQLVVDSFTDTLDADYGSGSMTLREALLWSNFKDGTEVTDGVDTITFDPMLAANLASGAFGTNTLVLNGKQLEITGDLVIVDPGSLLEQAVAGADIFRISANRESRVLKVGANANVEITGITFADGKPSPSESFHDGGVIWNQGNLLLRHSEVVNGFAGTAGGGIYNDTGVLRIEYSTIADNTATAGPNGGGIHNASGDLHVYKSTIARNHAVDGDFGKGGGIGNTGTLATIIGTTIDNNLAGNVGGGIHNGPGSEMLILNSTVSGNVTTGSAALAGGGIINHGRMEIHHSTIANNTSGDGGGIFNTADLGLYNSIVAANEPSDLASSVSMTFASGNNLFGTTPTGVSITTTDIVSDDPKISTLEDNGGPTLTHMLKPGSPAIDAADPTISPDPAFGTSIRLTDQRGLPLVDISTVEGLMPGNIPDIGAYEIQSISSSRWRFEAEDKSQFGPGNALVYGFGFDDGDPNSNIRKEPYFLGVPFDTGPRSVGGIKSTAFGKFGGVLNADISGRLGFDLGFYINSGSVDVAYDGQLNTVIDATGANEATISTFLQVDDGSLYTVSPKIGAFADLVLELDADVNATGCLFGCVQATLLDVHVDHTEEMFAVNRQDKDDQGRPAFFLGGEEDPDQFLGGVVAEIGTPLVRDQTTGYFYDLNDRRLENQNGDPITEPPVTPAFDGDIRYFNVAATLTRAIRDSLEDRLQLQAALNELEDSLRDFNNASNKLDRYRDELDRQRQLLEISVSQTDIDNARDAIVTLGGRGALGGGQPDGGKINEAEKAKADAQRRRQTVDRQIKGNDPRQNTPGKKLKSPKAIIGVSVEEAEGSLIGAQLNLEAGIGIGNFLDLSKNVGSMQVTLPDVNLRDNRTDELGYLNASTDAFPKNSELDFKRQLANIQLDVAGTLVGLIPGIGTALAAVAGTYEVAVGPLNLSLTTLSYNVGPQLNVTQDVEAVPVVEGMMYEFFTEDGEEAIVDVQINGEPAITDSKVKFNQGDRVTVIRNGITEPIMVIPTMTVDAVFSNEIGLDIDIEGLLEAFAFDFSAFGVSIASLGPLIREQMTLTTFDLGSVFKKSFELYEDTDNEGTDNGNTVKLDPFMLFDQTSDGRTVATALVAVPVATPGTNEAEVTIDQTPINQPVFIKSDLLQQASDPDDKDQLFNELLVNVTGQIPSELAVLDERLTVESEEPGVYRISGFTEQMLSARSSAVFALLYDAAGTSTITTTRISASEITAPPDTTGENQASISVDALSDAGFRIAIGNDVDIDGDGIVSPLTDGLLLVRHLLGRTGDDLTSHAVGAGAVRTTATEIENYIKRELDIEYHDAMQTLASALDLDGNGGDPDGADGILFARHMAGFTDDPLISDAIVPGSTRNTGALVSQYIETGRFIIRDEFSDEFDQMLAGGDPFGVNQVLVPDRNAVGGSSPYAALQPALTENRSAEVAASYPSFEYVLNHYGQVVTFEDVVLDDVVVSHVAEGIPLDFGPSDFRDLINNGLQNENPETRTGTAILGSQEPIFVRAPDAAAYEYESLGDHQFDAFVINPLAAGNLLLESAFDLYLFNESTGQWEYSTLVTAENPDHVGPSGLLQYTFPDPVSRFRLYSFPLPNEVLHDDDNLANETFDTTTGFLMSGGAGIPSIRLTQLAPRIPFSTPDPISVGFPVHPTDGAPLTTTFTVSRADDDNSEAEAVVSTVTSGFGTVPEATSIAMASTLDLVIRGHDNVNDVLVVDHSAGPVRMPITFYGGFREDVLRVDGGVVDLTDRGEIPAGLDVAARLTRVDATPVTLNEVELVDLLGGSPSHLILDVDAVYANDPVSGQLIVKADANDVVDLGTGWILAGTETMAGLVYSRYEQGTATVLVSVEAAVTSKRSASRISLSASDRAETTSLAAASLATTSAVGFSHPIVQSTSATAVGFADSIRTSTSTAAGEEVPAQQIVSTASTELVVKPGDAFNITFDYSTSPQAMQAGLHLRMHFDSSQLNLDEMVALLPDGYSASQVLPDNECGGANEFNCGGFDSDAATDQYLNLLWLDETGSWPGVFSTELFTATFTATDAFSGTTIHFTGNAAAGNSLEANDVVVVGDFDFGDAPTRYPTLLPNGARHELGTNLFLGTMVDQDNDGQPSAQADGDGADEDGVRVIAHPLRTSAGSTTASFLVTASAAGRLDAWIDFDQDGSWDDSLERISASSIDLVAGSNLISYTVPTTAASGGTFARFRVSSAGGLSPGGPADDGEVEDYPITIFDGDSAAPVVIDLSVGEVVAFTDGDQLVIRQGLQDVFRSVGSAVSGLHFIGTDANDRVGIGNLTTVLPALTPIRYEGSNGEDQLRLSGDEQTFDLTDATKNQIFDIEQIVIEESVTSGVLVVDPQSVIRSSGSGGTLLLVHNEDDQIDYLGDDWQVETPIFIDGSQRHVVTSGNATVQTINSRPFQNPLLRWDVNSSGEPTSRDALLVINFLGRFDTVPVDLSDPTSSQQLPEFYYDVNGSKTASALDALQVINYLGIIRANAESELVPRDMQTAMPMNIDGVDRDWPGETTVTSREPLDRFDRALLDISTKKAIFSVARDGAAFPLPKWLDRTGDLSDLADWDEALQQHLRDFDELRLLSQQSQLAPTLSI